MNINIKKEKNSNLQTDEINVLIEFSKDSKYVKELEDYISMLKEKKNEIIVNDNNECIKILQDDIIVVYSEGKYNYCRTMKGQYKIKSKLYEVEKINLNFMRISKCCVVNINHVKCFDLSQTGRIVVKLDDNTQEIVSRRRIRDVLDYLDERSI